MRSQKKFLASIFVVLMFLSMFTLFTPKVKASSVLRVPDDYATIQEAVNAASPGDTIWVAAGTYYEHLIVDKPVSLIGEDRETTIIDGQGTYESIIKIASSNVHISGFTLKNGPGVHMYHSDNIVISNNLIQNHLVHAIHVNNCSGVSVTGNRIETLQKGVISQQKCTIGLFHYSSDNMISGNTIVGTRFGIDLGYSHNNVIKNNYLTANVQGTTLAYSYNNIIKNNHLSDNHYGIIICNSSRNVIYHNNFINNTKQTSIYDDSFNNAWDNGYPSGGNYWSDYEGVDTDRDEIGDTPYTIDENNQDNYPLMHPWTPIETLIITNREELIEFAKSSGLAEEHAKEKVNELLDTLNRLHPEGMMFLVEKSITDPSDWQQIDEHIEQLWASHKFEYVVIVGSPSVIPFCVVDDPVPEWLGGEGTIETDFYYAEVTGEWPGFVGPTLQDLSIGRIIGANITDMTEFVKRYLDYEPDDTGDDALLSMIPQGFDSGSDISDLLTEEAGFGVLKLMEGYNLTDNDYADNLQNKGFIIHIGHGTFAAFKDSEFNFNFTEVLETGLGTTMPLVLGIACHTGDLDMAPSLGPRCISTAFINKGAIGFIGPTRNALIGSFGVGWAEVLAENLVEHLTNDEDLGTALMNAKRDYRENDLFWTWDDEKTLLEFVLYGDPKFNPIFPEESTSTASVSTIQSTIEVTIDIPEFYHSRIDGYDVIKIPGTELCVDRGYPILPIVVNKFVILEDEGLTNVNLKVAEKESLLGTFNLVIAQASTTEPISEIVFSHLDFYPSTLYKASVAKEPDGSQTLVLVVTPLQYNKETGEVVLYRHIELELTADPSTLKVKPLNWEISKPLVPTESVSQAFSVENLGAARVSEVNITAEGDIANWIAFDATKIVDLGPGESNEFVATITIPVGTPFGFYAGYITLISDFGSQSIPVFLSVSPPLPLMSMWITDSEFNNITSFDVVFTPDGKTDNYKLTATNPGQFYYNIVVNNTWLEPLNITVTYDIDTNFTPKGAMPIHVYADLARTIDITSNCTFSDNKITAYNVLPGEIIYVTIHLDYALKGTTWTKSEVETWHSEHTFSATADIAISKIKSSVTITDPEIMIPPLPTNLIFFMGVLPAIILCIGIIVQLKYLTRRRRKQN